MINVLVNSQAQPHRGEAEARPEVARAHLLPPPPLEALRPLLLRALRCWRSELGGWRVPAHQGQARWRINAVARNEEDNAITH